MYICTVRGHNTQSHTRVSSAQALSTKSTGFSGREIHKMFLSLQGAVYGTEECVLTLALWDKVTSWKLHEFERKIALEATAARNRAAAEGDQRWHFRVGPRKARRV